MSKLGFKREKGSVLLVVPVFFLALAVFMGSTIRQSETKSFYSEVRTERKMARVKKSLAIHAHRYYRIPCPADPALDPVGNAANFGRERASCDTAATQTGIVPFRQLGLTEFDIRDQWGKYLTYAVSPSFTRRPVVGGRIPSWQYTDDTGPGVDLPVPYSSNPGDTDENTSITVNPPGLTGADIAPTFVHKYCRQEGSWVEPTTDRHRGPEGEEHVLDDFLLDIFGNPDTSITLARAFNKNNYKAQFCCAASTQSFTTDFFSAENYKAALRGSNPLSSNGPMAFTPPPGDPADDITFRGGGLPWGNTQAIKDRTPGSIRLNYGDKQHGIKGGMALNPGDGFTDVDGDGAYNPDVDVFQKKIYGDMSLFMDINSENRSGVTLVLSDLEGEEPNRHVVYSVELYDTASGDTITNTPYDPGDPDSIQDDYPDYTDLGKANYNNTLFHGAQKIGNRAIAGVGKFEVNVYDFKKQIEASGYNPAKVRIKKVQLHVGRTATNASAISTQLAGLELTSPSATANTDIVIEGENGGAVLPSRDTAGYRPADEAVPAGSVVSGFEAPAYSLVSHGANGIGAFIVGTTNQVGYSDGAWENGIGDGELINADNIISGNRNFRAQRRIITNGNKHFDDIVMWDTQISLYNALPNGTCESAQAEVN